MNIELKEVLRRTDMKATSGRLALLDVLKKSDKPESINFLHKKLKNVFDQATLYRSLLAFEDAGIVRVVDVGHRHAHYEYAVEREHHHHLICKSCGAVEDVKDCPIEVASKMFLKNTKTFKTLDSHSLEFFGSCKACA